MTSSARASVVAAGLLVAASLSAQVRAQPNADTKSDAPAGTTVVIAEGVGKDEKEAKKAAFRDAVSRVVGTLVDAETLVKNDEVISERILEYSGGFVKTFDVLKSEKTADGLVRVRLKATVERLQIVSKLTDAKVSTKEVKGEDLLAEKMTKEDAKKNATELLAKLYEDLPKLLKAETKGAPQLTDARDGLSTDVVISVDGKAYGEFVKKATGLLDKIAVARDTGLVTGEKDGNGRMRYGQPTFYDKPELGENTPKGYGIWMLTHMDGAGTKMRWNMYWVDADPAATLKVIAGDIRLHIEFNDKDGKLVAEDEITLCRADVQDSRFNFNGGTALPHDMWVLWNYCRRQYFADKENHQTYSLFISPLVNELDTKGQGVYQLVVPYRHKMKFTDADIARIKEVKTSVRLHTEAFKKDR